MRGYCTYGDLDNIKYFYFYFLDIICIIYRFCNFFQIYQTDCQVLPNLPTKKNDMNNVH